MSVAVCGGGAVRRVAPPHVVSWSCVDLQAAGKRSLISLQLFQLTMRENIHQKYITHFYNLYQGRKEEVFYLTTYSTHFIYGYNASDIW